MYYFKNRLKLEKKPYFLKQELEPGNHSCLMENTLI